MPRGHDMDATLAGITKRNLANPRGNQQKRESAP
jgi:hypothetical protein